MIEAQDRPRVFHLIGSLKGQKLNGIVPGGAPDPDKTILSARIAGDVFYLEQTPSDGGFTATIRDDVFYLTPPPAGSNYKAEIQNDIFYLKEA